MKMGFGREQPRPSSETAGSLIWDNNYEQFFLVGDPVCRGRGGRFMGQVCGTLMGDFVSCNGELGLKRLRVGVGVMQWDRSFSFCAVLF